MTHPEPGGPSQQGRRDWMLSGVDGATVMLWAVTGNFWWVLLASAWGASSYSASLTAVTPRG